MIVIEQSFIENNTLKCRIKANYLDEGEKLVWFAVQDEYAHYFVSETSEVFLLAGGDVALTPDGPYIEPASYSLAVVGGKR